MYKDFLIFGEVYYIYNRVNGSENFFCELDNYCYFMIKLVEWIYLVFKIFVWCFMLNYFYLLICFKDEGIIM